MDAVASKAGAEAAAALATDTVVCQIWAEPEAEPEAAVGVDAVMSQAGAEADAGNSGVGCCDESGRGRGRQQW